MPEAKVPEIINKEYKETIKETDQRIEEIKTEYKEEERQFFISELKNREEQIKKI